MRMELMAINHSLAAGSVGIMPRRIPHQSRHTTGRGGKYAKDETRHGVPRDIQFVLPRRRPSSNKNNTELVPFFFPGQRNELDRSGKEGQQQRATDEVDLRRQSRSKKSRSPKEPDNANKEYNTTTSCSSDKILIQSVEEAVKDKVGRRPRTNSTDGELNLPQRGLCDENMVLQTYKWDMDKLLRRQNAAPPRGFVNLGNTCFLNATLQCLAYMPTLCQSVAALPASCYEANGGGKLRGGQRITMLLRALLRRVHGIEAQERDEQFKTSPIAPKFLHKAVTSCKLQGGHRFRPGRQEDAHELLIHLLDAMHEGELFAAGINPHASGWCDKLPIRRLHETTFVHRIFGGYFRSQLHCHKCGYKSNTYDPFLDLALEVSKKHINSLAAAFKEFMRKEKLDQNNRWRCSGCKKNVCPTKHLSVFRPPLSLCIHLKRFEYVGGGFFSGGGDFFGHRHNKGLGMSGNGGSKISKKIDFPALLSLPLSDGRLCQYLLTGVIIHVGKSATSGHYTAYVKQLGSSHRWYHMDDCHTQTVSEKAVLKERDAYVLFYTRKEVKLEFPVTMSSGGKGSSNGMPTEEPPENDPVASSAPARSPTSDPAALRHANKADFGSSESKTAGPNASGPTKGNLGGVRRSLDYVSREKGIRAQAKRTNKKRTSWSPSGTGKFDPNNDRTLLLGGIEIGNWNGGDCGPSKGSLRSTASKNMEHEARARKKKKRAEFWDSHIDEVKTPKKKSS